MDSKLLYETDDSEERSITGTLLDLLDPENGMGFCENPLATVCRILVKNISDFRFIVYCTHDDKSWNEMFAGSGFKPEPPPQSIVTRFLKETWAALEHTPIYHLKDYTSLKYLPKRYQQKWPCKSCTAIPVEIDGRRAAMLVVFYEGCRVLEPRQEAWLALLSRVISSLYARQLMTYKLHLSRTKAAQVERESIRSLQAMRKRMSEFITEVVKLRGAVANDGLDPTIALNRVEKLALAPLETEEPPKLTPSNFSPFANARLEAWVKQNVVSPQVKAIVGLRGTGKAAALIGVYKYLLKKGIPEERLFFIDTEDARFRKLKTARDILQYIESFVKTKAVRYLLLGEIGHITGHIDLIRHFLSSKRWNVWFTASNSHAATLEVTHHRESSQLSVFHLWADSSRPRSRYALSRVWGQIFMRDVVSGMDHCDIRAEEALAEYYSDHIGEIKAYREIAKEFRFASRTLSANTVRTYSQALINAYLIRRSPIYDVFEGQVLKIGARFFWTDLELRNWRFGPAPTNEERRLAVNRLFIELSQKYDTVYTPREGDCEFITLEKDGSISRWNPPGGGGGICIKKA